VKDEEAPLDDSPVGNAKETIAAIRHLEERVVAADGIVLRYGAFNGPRKRMFQVMGSGAGMASFIHIEDAARATLAAIERGEPGLYNIVDDEPAPASEWLPYLADAVGAKPPRHVPLWLGRLMAGEAQPTNTRS
jgi:nucleoside-diphosphate-sugar epimerase